MKYLSLIFISTLSLMAIDRIIGAGASFPAPLYFDWAYDYHKVTKNQVNYQSIGSGGGIRQIGNRMVDFGASDAPLKKSKLDKMRLLQFPAVIGTIVVAYNIDGIGDGELKLHNRIVANIYAGRITRWNDPVIRADNPDLVLPDAPITVVYRADGSGTTYNFTYFLDAVSPYWHEKIGIGKSVQWPVGVGGKGNEGVSSLLKQTPFSIGYIEYAYKKKNRFAAARLQSAEGAWVAANETNSKAAATYARWNPKEHFYQLLSLQPGTNSYPIVAATFILMPREAAKDNVPVMKFFDWAFTHGDAAATRLGYIPLPPETKQLIRAYWKHHVK